MSKKHDLPILLSHDTHTGMMLSSNLKIGGRDMYIVGLNKEIPSGDSFEMTDVKWIKAVMHFGDVGSMKIMADALTKEAKNWMTEVNDSNMKDKVMMMYDHIRTATDVDPWAVKVLRMVLDAYLADGCVGCAFMDVEEWEMPCARCKRNSKDYWRIEHDEG